MVREVLEARPHVAADRFLSVNLSPHAALTPEVHEAFAQPDRLDSIIVEITEQTNTDLDVLATALAELRARGALIAVDDAGAGYGSLARITALHPHFVKIDRSLVHNLDNEPAKAAVVETLSELASRIDAWVVAEGIERLGGARRAHPHEGSPWAGVRVRPAGTGDGGVGGRDGRPHPRPVPAGRP